LDNQCLAELAGFDLQRLDLEEGDAHIEVARQLGEPDEPDVGDKKGAKVALIRRKVPTPSDLFEDLLVRQGLQLFVGDDGSSEFKLAVETTCCVCTAKKWIDKKFCHQSLLLGKGRLRGSIPLTGIWLTR